MLGSNGLVSSVPLIEDPRRTTSPKYIFRASFVANRPTNLSVRYSLYLANTVSADLSGMYEGIGMGTVSRVGVRRGSFDGCAGGVVIERAG